MFRAVPSVRRLVGVDIDRQVVLDSVHRLAPLICDFLFRRPDSLTVDVYQGDLCQYDDRLAGIDAVTLIEV